jgi:hypothetical protein
MGVPITMTGPSGGLVKLTVPTAQAQNIPAGPRAIVGPSCYRHGSAKSKQQFQPGQDRAVP